MSTRTVAGSTGVDSTDFRRILGRVPTGVVVVSAQIEGVPYGLAVNSFTSVSLDPPLVAFCAAHTSSTWPQLRRAGGFAVSVLGRDHEDVCRLFAQKGADRYGGDHHWERSRAGHPVLADAAAWLECETVTIQRAGDHDVVIAQVTDGAAGEGAPLVFYRGRLTTVQD